MKIYKNAMEKIKLSDDAKQNTKSLYRQIKVEQKGKRNIRRFVKPVIAIAACIVLIISTGIGLQNGNNLFHTGNKNTFSISVMAAELKEGIGVPINVGAGYGGDSISVGDDNKLSYSIGLPLSCKGENIENITYSVQGAVFQIGAPKDDNTIVAGKEYKGKMSFPATLKKEDDVLTCYTEYTVKYQHQPDDNIVVSICNEKNISDDELVFSDNVEKQKQGMDELLKDVVITCTVKYKDGTFQSKKLLLKNEIMTIGQISPDAPATIANDQMVVTMVEMQ